MKQENLKKCIQCDTEFEARRTDQKYCSDACKGKAERERRQNRLNDVNQALVPVLQKNNTSPDAIQFYNRLADSYVEGTLGQTISQIPKLNDFVMSLTDPKVPINQKLWTIGGVVGGIVIGYQFSGSGKKLGGSLLGAAGGIIVSNIAYSVLLQASGQAKELEQQQEQQLRLSDKVEIKKIYSANEIKTMDIEVIRPIINGVLYQLIGHELNNKFNILVYGEAGSGKSHLATIIAGELGHYGDVLYVLAEETMTRSVQQRIGKYNLPENVRFFVSSSEQEILEEMKNYNYLVLDSLNGMMRYNFHTDFLRKLKTSNLKGSVLLNQVNKQGQFVGENTILHETDVEIKVNNCAATTGKNRYGASGNMIEIFKKPRTDIEKGI